MRMVGLARAYALVGRKAEAQKILEDLQRRSKVSYVPPYFPAVLYAALGRRDEAFASLEKAYTDRDRYMVWLNVDSEIDPLKPDPRFDALLRRVGFPQSTK